MTPTQTAQILVEALPYIRQFAGKSVVVKLGGAAIDRDCDLALAQDVLLLRSVGVRCVLVHGGGPQVDAMLRRVGKEPEFRDGLRVTDAETLEIVRMVLIGKINRDLVGTINSQAGEEPVAVGVSGEDAGLLTVTPADSSLGFVGNVSNVRAELIHRLLDGRAAPETVRLAVQAAARPRGLRTEQVLEQLVQAAADRRQQVVAQVVAATPLTTQQRDRLEAALRRRYGRVRLNIDVDPAVLGGLRVQVGSELVDGTVAARLEDARRRLAG